MSVILADVLPLTTLPVSQNPATVYLARLGPRSRITQASALGTLALLLGGSREDAAVIPWQQIDYQHSQAIRAKLLERLTAGEYAPATCNRLLAALRGVLRECWRLGQISAEQYHRAVDVQDIKADTLPRGRALSAGEFQAIFAACAQSLGPSRYRDAALIAVLYGGGLRRSEAVGLDLTDYTPEMGALQVLHGKGGNQRIVYLQAGAREALADWIDVRGTEEGPLFVRVLKSGRIVQLRLTDQSVHDILQRRATQASVQACTPHDLRRSFVSDLLDAGADISTVQRLAGHSDVSTTQRYDRRGEATKANASGLLHVPYTRKSALPAEQ